MINLKLIFGGAFNGKLEFTLNEFNLKREEVYFCKNDKLNVDKKVICGLHKFTYEALKNNKNPLEILKEKEEFLKDKIIICDDLNSGIVPLEKLEREWREENGKCLQWLSEKSSKVYRVFFGLETVIKNEED